MPDEKIGSVIEFLREALAYFASLGIKVRQLMSANGSAYRSYPVATFLHQQVIEHIFTRPYTPRTNGKAERFIQTSLREWAYAAVYPKLTPSPPTPPTLAPSLQLAQTSHRP
jgi:transposase InsO family protein